MEASAPSNRRWISLGAICLAAGMVWLAFADFSVGIPTVADDLHADLGPLQWANNAFSLVCGALVIAAGKFGDVFGRKKVLQLGIVLFGAFSIVAALASSTTGLIVGRGLMGIGAALILPATLALIPPQFSGKAQLTAFGVWQAVAWGGQAVGPAIGGVITDELGWEWLFWINIPLAAIAFLTIRVLTPESNDPEASSHIDWLGLATIGFAVFALLYALTEGPAAGWGDPVVLWSFIAAVALGIAWCLIELKVHDPLVNMSLFKFRPFDGALTANLTMNLAFAGLSYLLVLWLQNVRGYDAVEAGMLMLPSTLGIFVFIPVGGRLNESRGARFPVLIGLVVMSAGLLLLGFLSGDSPLWQMGIALVVIGIGLGLLSTPISNTAVGDVPQNLAGTAAGVFKMSSMVGGALGVALLSALGRGFSQGNADEAATAAGLTPDQVEDARRALVNSDSFADALTKLATDEARKVADAASTAFTEGVASAMVATGVLSLLVTVVVYFLWPKGAAAHE